MIRDEMMERMSAPEFLTWMAIDSLESSGDVELSAQTPEEIFNMFKPTDD